MSDTGVYTLYWEDGPNSGVIKETTDIEEMLDAKRDLLASGQVYEPGVVVAMQTTAVVIGVDMRWLVQLREGRWGTIPPYSWRSPVSWWYGNTAPVLDYWATEDQLATSQKYAFLQEIIDRENLFFPAVYAVLCGLFPRTSPIQARITQVEQDQGAWVSGHHPSTLMEYTYTEIAAVELLQVLQYRRADGRSYAAKDLLRQAAAATLLRSDDSLENPQFDLRLLWQGAARPWP